MALSGLTMNLRSCCVRSLARTSSTNLRSRGRLPGWTWWLRLSLGRGQQLLTEPTPSILTCPSPSSTITRSSGATVWNTPCAKASEYTQARDQTLNWHIGKSVSPRTGINRYKMRWRVGYLSKLHYMYFYFNIQRYCLDHKELLQQRKTFPFFYIYFAVKKDHYINTETEQEIIMSKNYWKREQEPLHLILHIHTLH